MATFTYSEPWNNKGTAVAKFPYPIWGGQTSHYVKVEQCAGPVFPVERNNNYAVEAPKPDMPQAQSNMTSPVFKIETRAQNFPGDIIPDVGGLPKYLVGPKFCPGQPDDGKSGYVPTIPVSDLTPQINGPVFRGVETGKYLPTGQFLPAKFEGEVLMSTPMFPVEHGSKYTTQPFGCSGKGLDIVSPKVLASPGNRDVGDRHAALIESKNKYVPEAPKADAPPPMHGPKLPNVESFHNYGPVPVRVPPAEARMEMSGPVWPGVESNNEFCKIEERVHAAPLFIGPKLPNVEEKNVYSPVEERTHGKLEMVGPVWHDVEHGNKYIPETHRVDEPGLGLAMCGPKFRGIDDSSKYNLQMRSPQIDSDRLMTAPIFPGIEAGNKYAPTEPPLAHPNRALRTEPMVAPKYPNVTAKNMYVPDDTEKPRPEVSLSGPKYPGIEESHKYGPVTERKETHKGICVPVYTEDHNNKYNIVPEKKWGEIIQANPVYRGVESRSTYNPVEEKVAGQIHLVGPVFEPVGHDSKYMPETTRVQSAIQLAGPVLQVDHGSKNNPKMEKAPIEGQRLMTAPIFPGIEASNTYGVAVYGP